MPGVAVVIPDMVYAEATDTASAGSRFERQRQWEWETLKAMFPKAITRNELYEIMPINSERQASIRRCAEKKRRLASKCEMASSNRFALYALIPRVCSAVIATRKE